MRAEQHQSHPLGAHGGRAWPGLHQPFWNHTDRKPRRGRITLHGRPGRGRQRGDKASIRRLEGASERKCGCGAREAQICEELNVHGQLGIHGDTPGQPIANDTSAGTRHWPDQLGSASRADLFIIPLSQTP